MNIKTIQAENRKKILKAIRRAGKDGVRAAVLVGRTGLCLRTVQTHIRALKSEGSIHSNGVGFWLAHNL